MSHLLFQLILNSSYESDGYQWHLKCLPQARMSMTCCQSVVLWDMVEPSGRKLGHWRCALGSMTLDSSPLSLYFLYPSLANKHTRLKKSSLGSFVCICLFCFATLGIKLRALHLPSQHSPTEIHPTLPVQFPNRHGLFNSDGLSFVYNVQRSWICSEQSGDSKNSER